MAATLLGLVLCAPAVVLLVLTAHVVRDDGHGRHRPSAVDQRRARVHLHP